MDNLRTTFGYLFEKIVKTANVKSLMQLSPCTTAMQKFQTSYMHSVFSSTFWYVITAQIPATVLNICSSVADYNENLEILEVF